MALDYYYSCEHAAAVVGGVIELLVLVYVSHLDGHQMLAYYYSAYQRLTTLEAVAAADGWY